VNEKDPEIPPASTQVPQPVQMVALRMHVEIELVSRAGEIERLEFEIVPDKEADFYSGFLSQDTPMARAILGRPVGSTVPYAVGDSRAIHILSMGPAAGMNSTEAAEKRRASVEEAKRQSERTNAIIFASSVEGKWGEYDADHL
jgi:hypothetical protein